MSGDWMFKVVPWFIGGVFALILCAWIAFGIAGVKAVKALDGCTPAVTSRNVDGEQQYSVGCKTEVAK